MLFIDIAFKLFDSEVLITFPVKGLGAKVSMFFHIQNIYIESLHN